MTPGGRGDWAVWSRCVRGSGGVRLRERYARGELTDEQFERTLDRPFETETPDSAAEWRTRERERDPVEE